MALADHRLTAVCPRCVQDAFEAIEPGKGMAWLFMTYAAFCVASLAFVFFYVPETKGMTLEQIERFLAREPDDQTTETPLLAQ